MVASWIWWTRKHNWGSAAVQMKGTQAVPSKASSGFYQVRPD